MSERSLRSQKKRCLPPESGLGPVPVASASGDKTGKKTHSAALPRTVAAASVQQAASSFSIQLGDDAIPSIQDAVLQLSSANLLHLKVTLIATSGVEARSIKEQLVTCMAQKDTLLTAIAAAFKSVVQLQLVIEHRLQPPIIPPPAAATAAANARLQTNPPPSAPIPANLTAMANSVLATFAPAMPQLKRLGLEGCISQETLQAFSPVFAQLRAVHFEALRVPIESLQYLCSRLPNLNNLTLKTKAADRSSNGQTLLKDYVFAAFKAMQACTQLTRLDLALAASTWLHISPESWDALPDSLQELQCTFPLTFSHSGRVESLRKFRRLVLNSFPFNGLDQMKSHFPNLEQLSILGGAEVSMECFADPSPDDIERLQGIFDKGLVLKCSSLKIEGKCRSLRDLFEVMPPLPSTVYVTLGLRGRRPHDFCLEDVARVFPNLKRLTLMDDKSLCMATPMTSEKFAAPLLKCKFLERLQLSVQLDFTTASLEKLCLGIPCLSFLFYFPWKGVDDEKVKAKVQAKKPGFEFKPCVGHGYYAHPAGAPSILNALY